MVHSNRAYCNVDLTLVRHQVARNGRIDELRRLLEANGDPDAKCGTWVVGLGFVVIKVVEIRVCFVKFQ